MTAPIVLDWNRKIKTINVLACKQYAYHGLDHENVIILLY